MADCKVVAMSLLKKYKFLKEYVSFRLYKSADSQPHVGVGGTAVNASQYLSELCIVIPTKTLFTS